MTMRYQILGRTGLRVSELCLGAMTLGGENGASRAESRRIIARYADAGGNFIDTANHYSLGDSERLLGELLGEDRDRFVLATKYTLAMTAGDANAPGNHRKSLVRALDDSLRRLRTDRVDLYWVHMRDPFTPVDEVMRALDDQVRAGKVLYVGVSNWAAWEVAQANTVAELRGWTPFAAIQVAYSLLERTVERELVPMARALGLSVTCWSPLAGGLLTGKYLTGGDGRLSDSAAERLAGPAGAIVREVVAIAGELGASPAAVALAWLRSRPVPTIPILGARSEAQLAESLACLDVELAPDQLHRLDAVSAIELGFPHDFLARDDIKRVGVGERWDQIVAAEGRWTSG